MLEPLFCYNEYQKGGVFYDDEKYCPDNGRPSMDPVMLIKIPFIQYLYGNKKHASDHERDRGKRCIPLVSRTRHVRSSTSFLYIWKELYPPFQKIQTFLSRSFQRFLEKTRLEHSQDFLLILKKIKRKEVFKRKNGAGH